MTEAPEYLRAGEIARLIGVSLRTVRRWIADEVLPSVKLGGARLVPRKGLERLMSLPSRERADSAEENEQE
jgi:excisionase family DNA binding protein